MASSNNGIWPSAIGALGSLVDTGLNWWMQDDLADQQWERQLEAMEMQREWDLEMWNKQNEYNSPAKQMERFKAAGLNPNLMYSQGSSGLASSAPTSSVPVAQRPSIGDTNAFEKMFGILKEGLHLDTDIALKEAQILAQQKQAEYYHELATNTSLDSVPKQSMALFYNYVNKFLGGEKDNHGNWLTSPVWNEETDRNVRGAIESYLKNAYQENQANFARNLSTVRLFNQHGHLDLANPFNQSTGNIIRTSLGQSTGAIGNTLINGLINFGLGMIPGVRQVKTLKKLGKAGKVALDQLKKLK